MVARVLVDPLVDEGRALLADLHRDGLAVVAAGWLHEDEYDRWHLYLVLAGSRGEPMGDAYDRVYDSFKRLVPTTLQLDHVRLARADEPLGAALRSISERTAHRPPRVATRLRHPDPVLADCDEALIYPPAGRMTPVDVARTVADLLGNRTLDRPTGDIGPGGSPIYPVATVEHGGRVSSLKPTGLRRDPVSGRLIVDAQNLGSGAMEHIPADEITDIRLQ